MHKSKSFLFILITALHVLGVTTTRPHYGNLITEQGTGEQNPLFQLGIDTILTPATT
jgi:hypothetical protein